jgi:hypothetical protein
MDADADQEEPEDEPGLSARIPVQHELDAGCAEEHEAGNERDDSKPLAEAQESH